MKILVISLAGIGDTLFATPLIRELRLNFPAATLEALVLWPGSRDILEGNPHLDAVHQRNLIRAPKLESLRFLLGLRRRGYAVSLNTHPQSRRHYRIVARLIGAPVRISHRYDHDGWLDGLLVNRALPQDYDLHAVENNLRLLELTGGARRGPAEGYELFLSEAERRFADQFVAENDLMGQRLFGIHVGSGGTKNLALRRWPPGHYVEFIQKLLAARNDVRVLLFGGPDEQADNAQVLARVDARRVSQPKTPSLRAAAALVGRCRAFLSVDTALMHVAAAMRVPGQVVIETPTWNRPIEPFGNHFILVPNPGVGGRNLEFYRYDGRGIRGTREELERCMASVSPDAVLAAVLRALG